MESEESELTAEGAAAETAGVSAAERVSERVRVASESSKGSMAVDSGVSGEESESKESAGVVFSMKCWMRSMAASLTDTRCVLSRRTSSKSYDVISEKKKKNKEVTDLAQRARS